MSDKQSSSFRRTSAGQAGAVRRRFEPKPMQLDETRPVRDAYRRWAPVYDYTFGAVSTAGRRHAVEIINGGSGRVLEVGVGNGAEWDRFSWVGGHAIVP